MSYKVRLLTEPPDVACIHDIATLAQGAYTLPTEVTEARIQNMLREGHVILTATDTLDDVVGLAVMLYFSSLKEGRVAQLEVLSVRPEHWGRGVDSQLLVRCIHIARQGGAHSLRTMWTREHTLPDKVLTSHGFTRKTSSLFLFSLGRT